jgi:hypothetical protein
MALTTELPHALSSRSLHDRIDRARNEVHAFIDRHGDERLRSLWHDELEPRFRHLAEQSRKQPEVAISLVGGTGAGKSTLLNALIGARVLPVSNMRACTAAISEVGYAEGPFRARIEFVSRESWEHEMYLLLADFRDTRRHGEEDRAADPRVDIARTVRDKLWAVYKPSEDADPAGFDPLNREEPPEITAALDAGFIEIVSEDLDQFRKQIARYLDSKYRFWPIVKSVAVRGPFEPLRDGARIVDLPGINDPNETREQVTRDHLATCRYVWIVFNIKRALTKDTLNLMQSDDFLRQIVMDGRADSLTLVGTAADDLDRETAVEEFDLDEDATMPQIVAARNKAVRRVVLDQLDDLAHQLANLAREPENAPRLAERLKRSKMFTVSAREFLRLSGLAKTQAQGFVDEAETEVPGLREHVREVGAQYGVTAHHRALEGQLGALLAEVNREEQSRRAALKNRAETSERQRKEMGAAVEAARKFLDGALAAARERFVQDLESGQALLGERVKRAVDQARHGLDQTLGRWEALHWATLKAVCRRKGTYVNASGRTDLPADLSRPILDGIAFAWSDFFGDKLLQTLRRWTDHLLPQADEYRRRLRASLEGRKDLPADLLTGTDRIFETTGKVLNELLGQTATTMQARIQEVQRSLYEKVPEQVRANMEPAFEEAGRQEGTGMKKRMAEILGKRARGVAYVMFNDAREAILNGVRGLNDWLAREYGTMTDAVRRNAALAAENLVVGGERLSAEALGHERQRLDRLAQILDSLAKGERE